MDVQEILGNLIASHPGLVAFVLAVGALRLLMKPMMEGLKKFTEATPWPQDDELLARVLNSKAWGVFAFVLDWIGSIKLPKKPDPVVIEKK